MKKRNAVKAFGPRLTSRSFFWQRGLRGPKAAGEMSERGMRPPKGPEMSPSFLERVWAWLHQTFPERQIYIRSDGRVQFFTFGPSLQATLAGLALIFLGWVAFATVNVVFKDRIIAAKDHRFQQMQSTYENRLADLQISYDDLNGALVGAEDKFKATADALSAKQNAISSFLGRKAQIAATTGSPSPAAMPAPGYIPSLSSAAHAIEPGMAAAPSDFTGFAPGDSGVSSLAMMPGPALPQPRVEKPGKNSALENAWKRVAKMASGLFDRKSTLSQIRIAAAYNQHPALQAMAAETKRLAALDQGQSELMARTEQLLAADTGALRNVVRRTGINPDQFLKNARAGVGGPEIPLDQIKLDGFGDARFEQAYLRASAVMAELDTLSAEIGHIPLVMPVAGAAFDRSSGFGARVDPFTGRYAFHPGVDFAGPWGAAVNATAPGVVVFAGNRGGYGNMVEIDHGFGLHTRYGHLSRINVVKGSKIGKGFMVGRVGSTGRSTGPHVHYEVLYNDAVRNPINFIEAGHHVL